MLSRDDLEKLLKNYTEQEKKQIKKDLAVSEKFIFDDAQVNNANPIYLATAGGPGSAKTTILEAFLNDNHLEDFAYIDPDQVILKKMIYTYGKSLSPYHFALAPSNYENLKNAYNKWRDASNYITHKMLQKALGNNSQDRYSIAHGTTSTNPSLLTFFEEIKKAGYRIVLLLCDSSDELRRNAVELREKEQGFVQTDPKDVVNKGADFPKRFDIYFQFADEIYFYWNEELKHGKLPSACAHYVKNASSPLTIDNETEWTKFCEKYLSKTNQQQIKICDSFKSLIPQHLLKDKSCISSNLALLNIHNERQRLANTAVSIEKENINTNYIKRSSTI